MTFDTIDPQITSQNSPASTSPAQPVALDVKSLFSSEALERKKASPQWHNRSDTAHHEKRIGMAPRGTRRSMGKR